MSTFFAGSAFRRTGQAALAVAVTAALLTLAGHTLAAQRAQPPARDLFERARMIEEMNDKNLADAIQLYQQVAARASENPALAAQAQLRVGVLYERLGRTAEAQRAFEAVVSQHSTQSGVVTQARARLAALRPVPAFKSITPRRLPLNEDGNLESMAFSPDGRWMAAIDWACEAAKPCGDLVVVDTASGATRQLQYGPCGSTFRPCLFGDAPVFSPNSQEIAYSWYDDTNNGNGQLRLIANRSGATPRALAQSAEWSFSPVAWSADGSILVTAQGGNPGQWQLRVVSVATGTSRTLKSLGSWEPSGISLSPDGRYIAYSALVNPPSHQPPARAGEPTDRHIYVLPIDGAGPEIDLVKTAGINSNPIWAPDGSHLLFVSDRSSTLDLWSVPVKDGRSAGMESLVRKDVGPINPFAFMSSGALYYGSNQIDIERVMVAEMPPLGTRMTGAPPPITASVAGNMAAWAPDGKSFAFSKLGPVADIVVHSIETGAEQVYSKKGILRVPVAWFQDGRSFIAFVRHDDGTRWLERVDAASGEFKPLLSFGPALAPGEGRGGALVDDTTFVMPGRDPSASASRIDRIVAFDLESRGQKDVFVAPASREIAAFAVSRSGRKLALVLHDIPKEGAGPVAGQAYIAQVGMDGTGYREIYTASQQELERSRVLAWTRDETAILFRVLHESSETRRIMQVPVDGGAPQFTGISGRRSLNRVDVNRDGSRLAYSMTGRNVEEVWVIDNLLQNLK